MKKLFVIILALALCLSAAACGETVPVETPAPATPAPETPAQEATAEPEIQTEPEPTEEPEEALTPENAPYVHPFNGQGLEERFDKRPFAIMINNLKPALPHHGITEADIIFEVPVEGGITRMMGIFSDMEKDTAIGSVRSIRPYFVDIAMSFDAVTVHAGESPTAGTKMYVKGIDHIDGIFSGRGAESFYRNTERYDAGVAVEHCLFGKAEDIRAHAEERGFALELTEDYDSGLRFASEGTPAGGETAESVSVNFSLYKNTLFTYDSEKDIYTAYQQELDYIDGNTGEKLDFKNIIVMKTGIGFEDNEGRLTVNTTGSGEGYFACGGKIIPITWERDGEWGAFRYYLTDGSELKLETGRSYIAILSVSTGSVEYN